MRPWFNGVRLIFKDPDTGRQYPMKHPNYRYFAKQTKHGNFVYVGGEKKTKEEKDEEKKAEQDAREKWSMEQEQNEDGPITEFEWDRKARDPYDLLFNHPDIERAGDYISGELKHPYWDAKKRNPQTGEVGMKVRRHLFMDAQTKKYLDRTDFKPGNLVKARFKSTGGKLSYLVLPLPFKLMEFVSADRYARQTVGATEARVHSSRSL